jgi:hypothetical protein
MHDKAPYYPHRDADCVHDTDRCAHFPEVVIQEGSLKTAVVKAAATTVDRGPTGRAAGSNYDDTCGWTTKSFQLRYRLSLRSYYSTICGALKQTFKLRQAIIRQSGTA